MRLVGMAAGLGLLLAAASPALATPKKGQAGYDPDREICKSRPVVGSRVARQRECHSAQQWEEMKLAEQIGLGRQQFNGDNSQSANELNMIGRIEAGQKPQ